MSLVLIVYCFVLKDCETICNDNISWWMNGVCFFWVSWSGQPLAHTQIIRWHSWRVFELGREVVSGKKLTLCHLWKQYNSCPILSIYFIYFLFKCADVFGRFVGDWCNCALRKNRTYDAAGTRTTRKTYHQERSRLPTKLQGEFEHTVIRFDCPNRRFRSSKLHF